MALDVGSGSLGMETDLPSTQDHTRQEIGVDRAFFLREDSGQ